MKLIRGVNHLSADCQGCVATIGNFDGIHLGHQQLLQETVRQAREQGLQATVIMFEPQPNEYFQAESPPARLSLLRDKLRAFAQAGVDQVLCLPFNQSLAQLSASDFVQSILVDGLAVKTLITGQDFRFGYRRQGDIDLLRRAAQQYHFTLTTLTDRVVAGQRVSSTAIRQALAASDFALAAKLLGRIYSVQGAVIHGDKRGRLLQFPTANIAWRRHRPPLTGVFAVHVHGLAAAPLMAMANFGRRPTVGGLRCLLEVHIFDFDQDIYGKTLQVDFLCKLRDEQRFASLALLQQQLQRDFVAAREYFADVVSN